MPGESSIRSGHGQAARRAARCAAVGGAERPAAEMPVQGAKAFGDPTALWTWPRVGKPIWEQLGVRHHVHHIGRLLWSFRSTPRSSSGRQVLSRGV